MRAFLLVLSFLAPAFGQTVIAPQVFSTQLKTYLGLSDAQVAAIQALNTAYSQYQESFMSWAADAYVVKSSDLSELKDKIKKLLAK